MLVLGQETYLLYTLILAAFTQVPADIEVMHENVMKASRGDCKKARRPRSSRQQLKRRAKNASL